MFEEIDLHIADTNPETNEADYIYTVWRCSGNRCSNSSCAGTTLRYCC